MRFQVSQVMDAIEQRLTTDVTGAQAVVDVGAVVRHAVLDGGRPVNLVRIGMVVDALGRYLFDEGSLLYGVADRSLLSEQAFTSKERMVLGRWADDGLMEVCSQAPDRVLEIAHLTGLPVIAVGPLAAPLARYGWLADDSGRVLRISQRGGVAVLTPVPGTANGAVENGAAATEAIVAAVGRAAVPVKDQAPPPAAEAPAAEAAVAEAAVAEAPVAESLPVEPSAAESPAEEPSTANDPASEEPVAEESPAESPGEATAEESPAEAAAAGESATEGADTKEAAASDSAASDAAASDAAVTGAAAAEAGAAAAAGNGVPGPSAVGLPAGFAYRGVAAVGRTHISWHRFLPLEPDPEHARVLRREWRCASFECAAFGEHRQLGQPVPRLRGDVPVCPRHGEPMVEVGPRPAAYPVSIVVDDLPRRRLVVRAGRPVSVGREQTDPDVVSVVPWLHTAAAAWVSPVHVRLEAAADGLTVVDLSENGTMLWQRKGPDDPGMSRPLLGESHLLGEWDSVELYTGIELMRGDRRIAGQFGRDEFTSVLCDAPTAAYHQIGPA